MPGPAALAGGTVSSGGATFADASAEPWDACPASSGTGPFGVKITLPPSSATLTLRRRNHGWGGVRFGG